MKLVMKHLITTLSLHAKMETRSKKNKTSTPAPPIVTRRRRIAKAKAKPLDDSLVDDQVYIDIGFLLHRLTARLYWNLNFLFMFWFYLALTNISLIANPKRKVKFPNLRLFILKKGKRGKSRIAKDKKIRRQSQVSQALNIETYVEMDRFSGGKLQNNLVLF